MRKKRKIIIVFLTIIVIFIIAGCVSCIYNLSAVNNDETTIELEIEKGSSFLSIASMLKEKNLIRSKLFYKLYIKIYKVEGLEAGIYYVNSSMDVKELVTTLSGKSTNVNVMNITFKEGLPMQKVAQLISESTEYTIDEIIEKGNNQEFLKRLINEYWFLTDDILNEKIYYPLDGYLFPNTYEFLKDASIEDIFRTLLNGMESTLTPYKTVIENSEYTIHEIITLASMIQSEGNNVDDFKKMASVFLTRLDKGMKLQSCASAYYGDKKIMGIDEFGNSYQKNNPYNTYVIPGIPVAPISNPGKDAIDAVLNPSNTDYLYFASDKAMKVYFSKTYAEHQSTVAQLKKAGNWYGS